LSAIYVKKVGIDIFLSAISFEISSKLLNGLSAMIHFTQLNTVVMLISEEPLEDDKVEMCVNLSAIRLLKRSEATAPMLRPQMMNYRICLCL
jgi:hypothetical protein